MLNTYHWNKFTAGADTEDEESRVTAAKLLQIHVLLPYLAEAEQALQYLERTGDSIPVGAKKALINRWKQIKDVTQQALLIHGPMSTAVQDSSANSARISAVDQDRCVEPKLPHTA